jgi:hypothetical protein
MLPGMRRLFVIAIALPIAVATGCRDENVAKLEAVRNEVCACKTAACGEEAMKKLPATGESNKRSRKVAKEVMDCLQKLLIKRDDTHTHDHDDDEEHAGEGSAGSAQP